MILKQISDELKQISDESGKHFLNLSTAFPILIEEFQAGQKAYNADTGQMSSIQLFNSVQTQLTEAVEKQKQILVRNKDFITTFQKKNTILMESFVHHIDFLKDMSNLVLQIKDESAEMEIISLNAMVVSIKSGKQGQAFSYITSNLKRLSFQLISQSDLLIAHELIVQDTIKKLQDAVTHAENLEKERGSSTISMEQDNIIAVIESIAQNLNRMLQGAAMVKQPIIKAMEGIQIQDIIRQSIDDIQLTINKIQNPLDSSADETRLDQYTFNIDLILLATQLLESIANKLAESIEIFKSNRDQANQILSDVEKQRQEFVTQTLDSNGTENNLKACIANATQELSDFVKVINSYQDAQLNILTYTEVIQTEVQKMQDCFEEFFPIIKNLQYVAIAQRIEIARNPALASIHATVEHMSNLITQTNSNVQVAQKHLHNFTESSVNQTKEFSTDFSINKKQFDQLNGERSDFTNRLQKLEEDFFNTISNFKVYSSDFIQSYQNINDSIDSLQRLLSSIKNTKNNLELCKQESKTQQQKLLKKMNLDSWTIQNNSFNDFIHHFTITSDKKAAGTIAGVTIENGVEAGEITFF